MNKPIGTAAHSAVLARGLGKSYGSQHAVACLDLIVPTGEIFGFLGPNGAGKTTTINMLCTLVRPTSGRAEVAGYDVVRGADDVRRHIGLVFQETTLDTDLTAAENLRFQAELFGLPRRRQRQAVEAMLELVGLASRQDSLVRSFSGGMRRRLEIARGLVHSPRVLFLDEPTTGLDPQTRATIWDHLRRLRCERGVTIFLTTHHLEEAENCDRIAIIDHGKLVAEGTPQEFKAMVGSDNIVLHTSDDATAAQVVRERFNLDVQPWDNGLRIAVADGPAFVSRLCAELLMPVHSVMVNRPTLDDVFLHYTGRAIREVADEPASLAAAARRRR